jgi:hypothetical protein
MKRFAPGLVSGLAIGACLVAGGCATSGRAGSSEDQPLFAAGWRGPPPRVAVQLTGTDASPDKQARCAAELARAGAVVDETGAAARAVLTLQPGGHRLQVTTQRRGLVRDEARPDGSVERLCNDALYALVVALRSEMPGVASGGAGAGAAGVTDGPSLLPPSQQPLTSQSYSAMPLFQERNRDLPADQPTTPLGASGAINRGPIRE